MGVLIYGVSSLRVLGQGLSRQQAYITIIDGLCNIVDMGNGDCMKVNDVETTRSLLIDGDLIQFGEAVFKIKLL